MKWGLVLVVVATIGLCHAGVFNLVYTSDHTISPDFANWLNNRGFSFSQFFASDLLSLPIIAGIDMIMYQNDGGTQPGSFNPAYQTNIENFVSSGGIFLYYGRDSLGYADPLLLNMLGLTDRISGNQGDSLFNLPIAQSVACNVITNGYRRNIRGVTPSEIYPYWVERHLNFMTEVLPDTNAGTVGCLPSSQNSGYHLWTVRNLGEGQIIFMSTSTYSSEELYKQGFYQAAFLNAYFYTTRGEIFGDPHVVTLSKQTFDMPLQSFNRYFNFFSSPSVNLNGYIAPLLGVAPGLWVTRVGLQFTQGNDIHRFFCYIDEDLVFHFVLDDRDLVESENTDSWSFSLETSHALIGTWHDKSRALSTGLFNLHAEDGSRVVIQAVEWRDAPSFSVRVSESQLTRDRNIAPGLLQHPDNDSETRDLNTDDFNVFIYERESIFP